MDTGAGYYGDMDVVYYGVLAEDVTTFDLSQYFFSAARFMEETLSNPQSKTAQIQVQLFHTEQACFAAIFIVLQLDAPLFLIYVSPDKLLVHCVMGRSRSATLFLAYLMICENMTLVEAVEHVKARRRIIPNWGFLKQLRELDMQLVEKRKGAPEEG